MIMGFPRIPFSTAVIISFPSLWCISLGKAAAMNTVVSKIGFLMFTADYLVVFFNDVKFFFGVVFSDYVCKFGFFL